MPVAFIPEARGEANPWVQHKEELVSLKPTKAVQLDPTHKRVTPTPPNTITYTPLHTTSLLFAALRAPRFHPTLVTYHRQHSTTSPRDGWGCTHSDGLVLGTRQEPRGL